METTTAVEAPARKKKGLTGSLKAIIGLPSTRKAGPRVHRDDVAQLKSETKQPGPIANDAVIDHNLPGTLTRGATTSTQSNLEINPEEQTKNLRTSATQTEARDPNRILTDLEAFSIPSKATSAATETSRSWTNELIAASENLWDKAYEDIRMRHRRLVNQYETILFSDLDTTASSEMKSAEVRYKEVFNHLRNQDNSSIKKSQMKDTLRSWLLGTEDDVDNNVTEASEFDRDQITPAYGLLSEPNSIVPGSGPERTHKSAADQPLDSLRQILRTAIDAVPTGAEVAWVAIWSGSQILLNPNASNKDECEGLIHVITRMQWYDLLPNLVGNHTHHITQDLKAFSAISVSIRDLYKAVLLYLIQLVCSHCGRNTTDFLARPSFLTPEFKTITNAESVLALFNNDRIGSPLHEVLENATEETVMSKGETGLLLKPVPDLLDCLHLADPRLVVSNTQSLESQAMSHMYSHLLEQDQYQSFLDWERSYRKVLWITSDPGLGKTMLLNSIVQAISKHEQIGQDYGIAFFFFDYSRPECNNAAACLKSLIWLLVANKDSLGKHLEDKRRTTDRAYFDDPNDFPALSGIFFSMIEDDSFPETYFVVDALDEGLCDEGQYGLDDFLRLVTYSMQLSMKVRWLVSSDNAEMMKEAFEGPGVEHLSLKDASSSGATANDYVQDKVKSIAREKHYDDRLEKSALKTLTNFCGGNYLWADIACTALQAEDIWHVAGFLKELRKIENLADLYKHMWEEIQRIPKDARLCGDVLKSMVVTGQSLHADELKHLVGFETRVDLRVILQKCSPFIRTRDNIVSFQHQSAQDFMQRNALRKTKIPVAHKRMTIRCLDYLSGELNKGNLHRDSQPVGHRNTPVTGKYSSLHWITHLFEFLKNPDSSKTKEKRSSNKIVKKMKRFVEQNLLQWVDVLAREEQLTLAGAMVQKVDLYLQSRQLMQTEMHNVIRDLHLFLRLHQSILTSNKITAANTVLYCPMNSSIRKSWITKILPWVTVPPLMSRHWTNDFTQLEGHRDWIRTIAFSSDGRFLASGSDDSSVRIWDAEMGTTQHMVKVRRGWIQSVAFSGLGIVAAGSDDYSITLWQALTGREIAHMRDLEGTPYSLCFSPDGRKLAALCESTVRLWEAEAGTSLESWTEISCPEKYNSPAQTIMFSPEGKLLVAMSDEGKIHIIDAATSAQLRIFEGCSDEPSTVFAFSNDGKLFASGGADGTVIIWDSSSLYSDDMDEGFGTKGEDINHKLCRLELRSGGCNSIAFSSNEQKIRLAAANEHIIQVWYARKGEKIQTMHSQSSNIRSVTFAPDGSYLATGSFNNKVHLWYAPAYAIEGGPADPLLGEGGPVDPLPGEGGPADPLPGEGDVYRVTPSADGRYVAAARSDGLVFLWDVIKKQVGPHTMPFGANGPVISIAFSPKGNYIACSFFDSSVRVCEVASGKQLHVFNGHTDWAQGLAWSRNEGLLASASEDYSIRIWKIGGLEAGTPIQVLEKAHGESYANCIAFCPTMEYLVSGGDDESLAVWKRDEQCQWRKDVSLGGHNSAVVGVLVRSDSKHVISFSDDKIVRVWNIETQELIRSIEAKWSIPRMWFPPQGEDYIMTPHGAISLTGEQLPPAWSPWRLRYDDACEELWITLDDDQALFLPPRFSPESSCIIGDQIIMGVSSQLHVYELSKVQFDRHRKGSPK